MIVKLKIHDDDGRVTIVPLVRDETTIGRKDGNTIRLTERNVSRYHAKIRKENGNIFIEDLDSYNGVKINGERIHGKADLRVGDMIQIGDYQLALFEEAMPALVADEVTPARGTPAPHAEETTQKTTLKQIQTSAAAAAAAGGVRGTEAETFLTDMEGSDRTAKKEQFVEAEAEESSREATAVIRLDTLKAEAAAQKPAGISPAQAAKLVVIGQHFNGRVFPLDKTEVVIGRTEDNDVVLDHRSVSRHHAKIVYPGDIYRVVDMNSANGVLVNGEEYASVELRPGDIIELGYVKFRFVAPGEDAAAHAEAARATVKTEAVSKQQTAAEVSLPVSAVEEEKKPGSVAVNWRKTIIIAAAALVVGAVILILSKLPIKTEGGSSTSTIQKGLPGPQEVVRTELERLFDQCDAFMKQGKWDDALKTIETTLQKYPSSQQAERRKGLIELEIQNRQIFEEGERDTQEKDWDSAWERSTKIPESSFYYSKAVTIMSEIKGALVSKHLDLARKYEKDKKYLDTYREFEEALYYDENNKEAQDGKARVEKKMTDLKIKPKPPTHTKSKPEISKRPAEPEISPRELSSQFYQAGNRNLIEGKYDQAIEKYQKAIKTDPTFPDVHRGLGIAYAKKGIQEKAAYHYQMYINLAPNASDAPQIKKFLEDYYKSIGR